MRKAIYTVNIGNYIPEIAEISIPVFEKYAARIGADFIEITSKEFSDLSNSYEKMQIFKLGAGYDCNIYFDLDVILSPSFPDLTALIPIDIVGHIGAYGADSWFDMDDIFNADLSEQDVRIQRIDEEGQRLYDKSGHPAYSFVKEMRPRRFACCDRILYASKDCHNVWKPSTLALEEILKRARREHFVGEWNVARNVAENHYKEMQIKSLEREKGAQQDDDAWIHLSTTIRKDRSFDINNLKRYAKEGQKEKK